MSNRVERIEWWAAAMMAWLRRCPSLETGPRQSENPAVTAVAELLAAATGRTVESVELAAHHAIEVLEEYGYTLVRTEQGRHGGDDRAYAAMRTIIRLVGQSSKTAAEKLADIERLAKGFIDA